MGENLDPPEQPAEVNLKGEEEDDQSEVDFGQAEELDVDNDNNDLTAEAEAPVAQNEEAEVSDSDEAVDGGRRTSRRRRKKRFVDFDADMWEKDEAYVVSDRVLLFNPAAERQAERDLQITSELTLPTIKESEDRVAISGCHIGPNI